MAAHLPVFQDAGLLGVIADPIHTPVTLFWPTDQALQALPPEQQDFLFKQDNKDKLKKYLKFHVIRDAKVFCFVHMWLQQRPSPGAAGRSVCLHLHRGLSSPSHCALL